MIDAARRWQALTKVMLPVARNGRFATAVFTFIFAWNDCIFAGVLTRTEVATFGSGDEQFGAQPTIWAKISA